MSEHLDPCRTCGTIFPLSGFYANDRNKSGHHADCKRCYLAKRRNPDGKRRMPRHNAAGNVWCPHCDRYRDPGCFKPHPNRTGKLWWSCRDCTRAIDKRRRTAKLADPSIYASHLDHTNSVRRRRRSSEILQRREELRAGIAALRAKGWTKSAIARAMGAGLGNVIAWERGEVKKPRRSTVDRLYALIGRAPCWDGRE